MSPTLSTPERAAPKVGVTLPSNRTPSRSPGESLASPQGRGSEEPTGPATPTGSDLQRTEDRIRMLERLVQAKEREKDLLDWFGIADELCRKRQRSESPTQESRKAIKVKNIIQFNTRMTFRRRQEWLQDLERAFAGDP